MAEYARVLVSMYDNADPEKDKITNTIYFKVGEVDPFAGPDWQQLTQDVGAVFAARQPEFPTGVDKINVRIYSMEDAVPREPRGEATETVSKLAAGNREVALCLSFRGASNTARQRGRLFCGPFGSGSGNERPVQAVIDKVASLADALANVGGVNVDWCVYSPTTYSQTQNYGASFFPVKHSWVDNAWDVQRSRGLPPTTRVTDTHDE